MFNEKAKEGSSQQPEASSHPGFADLFKGSRRRGILFVALVSYLSFGLLMQVFPPVLNVIQQDYRVDHATASLVMTLFLAPVAATALPAGFLADRNGAKRTGLFGFPLMAAGGLVSALIPGFAFLIFGRVISGIGGGLLLVSILKLLTEAIPHRQHGLAFGFFIAGLPIGTGLAFDVLTPFNAFIRWQGETLIAVVVVILAWATFARIVPRSERAGGHERAGSISAVIRNGSMLRLGLSVILGYTAIIGFTTWAPSTLVSYSHIPLVTSSIIASVLLLIDIPLGPFWGGVSDKFGRRKLFILLAFMIYLIGSVFVPFVGRLGSWVVGPALVAVVATMGTGCAMFFPSALTVPAQSVSSENYGAAYGLFFTTQVVGMTIGPILIGYVLDVSSASTAFLSISAITFAGLVASLAIRSK